MSDKQDAAAGPSGQQQQQLVPAADSSGGAAAAASSSGSRAIAGLLERMRLQRRRAKTEGKEKYAFWETQPVMQFSDAPGQPQGGGEQGDGPIDAPKTVADVRQQPYALPDAFAWCECDLDDEAVVHEVYDLLHRNYVEDDDAMFRFSYSPGFLKWALQPPGFRREWHVGVRVKAAAGAAAAAAAGTDGDGGPPPPALGKLVAFIGGVPTTLLCNGARVAGVEINFLCVLKKLRSKRLAPVLIREITRRVNLRGIWQAAYTAGVVLPRPVASCRYWHRSLNPKKLIDVGFSALQPRMTMARTIRLYRLPGAPSTPGFRPMEPRDVPGATRLLNGYLRRFKLTQHFTEQEAAHWLLPRDGVVSAFVVDAALARQQQQQQHGKQQPANGQQLLQQQQQAGAAGTAGAEAGEGAGAGGGAADGAAGPAAAAPAAAAAAAAGGGAGAEAGAAAAAAAAANGGGGDSGDVVSLVSFYTLPSSILGHAEHKELRAAYMFYTVPGATPLPALLSDAMVAAVASGHDVFNALDLLENGEAVLKELKFGIGDGTLNYYLYNWRMHNAPLDPSEVALILQ